jgi:hypothetical protein
MPNSQSQEPLEEGAAIVQLVFNSLTPSRDGYVKVNERSGKRPRIGLG